MCVCLVSIHTYVRMSWVHGYQKKVSKSINLCLISLNISESLTKPGVRFSGLVRPNDPPASTPPRPPPPAQGWGYMHSLFLYLMWVLWIQTQVLLFGQQVCTTLSHLSSPLPNFWQDQNPRRKEGWGPAGKKGNPLNWRLGSQRTA